MRSDASRGEIATGPLCRYCFEPYSPRKPWQRFCSPKCRLQFHVANDDGATRAAVASVRVLKRGRLSIVLHVDASEIEALRLEPGALLDIIKP